MRMRFSVAVVGVASLVVGAPACEELPWALGLCEEHADCDYQAPGTLCVDGICACPDLEERVCCPDGTMWCAWYDRGCQPRALCEQPPVITLAAPGAPCLETEDCRGPIDPRCGAVLCEEGKCRFDVQAGDKIENQYPGDCKVNICNYDGDVEKVADSSDPPRTGIDCAWELCDGTEPVWSPVGDGYPCISKDGICIQGQCKDCSEVMGQLQCPGSLLCDWDTCVPASCKDGLVSGDETAKDCGGSPWPSCRRCDVSEACIEHSDCFSNSCQGGVCQVPTHDDGQINKDETGVDCGYPGGSLHMCKDGEGCRSGDDCMSDVCYFGKCLAPTCTDNRQNGAEVWTDCGGDTCQPCPPESK